MVGGMGHSLMVSLGHSVNKKNEVICLDGDGALLMHFGSLRTSGIFGKKLKAYSLQQFLPRVSWRTKNFL